jgi:outer membrane receptor protein involved in Fe transport
MLASLAAASLALAGPARAEDPELVALFEMSLEELLLLEVTSATHSEQSSQDAPATVYLLTHEMIRARGYRTLIELLQDLPELQVSQRSYEESPNGVIMRGIVGNDKFLILRDGVRASPVTGRPDPLLQGLSLFDVERVEVVLGPASALYGAGAFAGIVNIITRDGGDLQGGMVTGSYGLYDTTHDAVMWGDEFGRVEVSVWAQLYHSDDPYLPEAYPDDYAGFLSWQETGQLEGFGGPVQVERQGWHMPQDAQSAGAKISLDELELSYFISAQRWVPAYAATSSQTTYSDESQYYRDYRQLISMQHQHSVEGRFPVELRSLAAYTASWLDSSSGFRNIFTGYERVYKKEWASQLTVQEIVQIELAEGYLLTGGVSYDGLTGMPNGPDLDRPYEPTLPTSSQEVLYPGTDIPASWFVIHERNLGGTLQLEAEPAPWVRLTLGSRYDHHSRSGGTFNPRAGVVLRPLPAWTTKLLYGEAFLAPTLYASFQHYGNFNCAEPGECSGGFFAVPNPDLEPEKLRTGEISTTYAWTPDLVTQASAFYTDISNIIDPYGDISVGSFLGVGEVELQTASNRGSMEVYGGTTRAEARLALGALDLRPSVAYTFTTGDIEMDRAEDRLPLIAPHMVKAALDLKLGGLSVAPRLTWLSAIEQHRGPLPASAVVDLSARYDNVFDSERLPISVFADAHNLLDQRYYRVPTASLGGGFTMSRIPQDPLRVDAGVTIEF